MSDGRNSTQTTDGHDVLGSTSSSRLEYIDERQQDELVEVSNVTQTAQPQPLYQAPQPPQYQQEPDEIVQVVYQSNQSGSLVGVESSLISGNGGEVYDQNQYNVGAPTAAQQPVIVEDSGPEPSQDVDGGIISGSHQQQPRAASTLPSVAEESTSSTTVGYLADDASETNHRDFGDLGDAVFGANEQYAGAELEGSVGLNSQQQQDYYYDSNQQQQYNPQYEQQLQFLNQQQQPEIANPIYSTVNKTRSVSTSDSFGRDSTSITQQSQQSDAQTLYENTQQAQAIDDGFSLYTDLYNNQQKGVYDEKDTSTLETKNSYLSEQDGKLNLTSEQSLALTDDKEKIEDIDDISQILLRQKQGAAESGSLRNPFKKKLGVSVSTNENDLTAHRQKLLESQQANTIEPEEEGNISSLPKFKRTHSVSFNVGSSRSGRHSVDIRNLPSYLTVKRASIVDVAKGAMSSLMHSFGSGGGSTVSQRRDSSPDEGPIFEEPIAPTLSLGQRVALVKSSGAEFGTVGWIGQLPDVDDDWIVGVIFDNMIGNSDGEHNGVRYFYARENYAMFVPLSTLTKTDNYIGRPETGTMLSRMSVSLKPGQLISIQRSSIRLQHCFLNAPHQRVGHDVRAVSNRLHCQCHNCGPCAHLTKQGRISAIPPFGAHHAPNKKNSLAHAAVEILAHHHHHYHEEEHKGEEDHQFGDNAAHACNFVRYSCCQQTGAPGHDFSADCEMVRPELLDNLIHAPRAPHRRHRLRRNRQAKNQRTGIAGRQQNPQLPHENKLAINDQVFNDSTMSTTDGAGTMRTWDSEPNNDYAESQSSYSSYSSRSSSRGGDVPQYEQHINDSSPYPNQGSSLYNTFDTRMSLVDQQRFIYQRESSTFRSHRSYMSDDSFEYGSSGFGSKIRRCFACLTGRKSRDRRPKRQRQSRRERKLEYRRRQFTFVPSTLAKPHEDLATHGIIVSQNPVESNSDYSSYSKSSSSSRSISPQQQQPLDTAESVTLIQMSNPKQQSMTIEHGVPASNEQLKSSFTHRMPTNQTNSQINYDDYTLSDEYGSYKKNGCSCESTLTDLGYFETMTNSSSDTFKQIVEQAINEQVAPPSEPTIIVDELFSPIISANESNLSDQIDVSSPTASLVEEENVCQGIDRLDLNSNGNSSNQ